MGKMENTSAISEFLFELYHDASECEPDELRIRALRNLQRFIPFDFGVWGGGWADGRLVTDLTVLNQSDAILGDWEAVAEQDAFWSMHDAMFQWGALSEDGAIRRRAAAAGVRLDELDRCQAREWAAEQIGRDQDLAHSLQLERAPLFAIGRMEDDQRIRIRGLLYGALPIEQFDKAIRAMGVRSAGQDVAGKAGMEPESKGSWASERRGIP